MRLAWNAFTAALSVLLLQTTPALADPDLQEGNWEITINMEMEGLPFAMPPVTHNQCITRESLIPDSSEPGQDCKILDHDVNGSTVSWRMQCDGDDGRMEGEGRITYAGSSYEGAVLMKVTGTSGEVTQMKLKHQGRHTGPCKSAPGTRADNH